MKREEITLSGTQILNIPIDMRVGGIQETITVTGETPVVDVQSARKEVVLDQEVIQTIPATRSVGGLLNATAGLTVDNNGIALSPTMTFFSANGGANNEGRMAVSGMTVGARAAAVCRRMSMTRSAWKKLQSTLAAASARRTPAVRS